VEAGMMSLTRLGHFRSGIIRQSKERSRQIDREPRLIAHRPDALKGQARSPALA
jgi:hypothetical protein